jgi:Ni/Co efflux regulator RcnB
MKRILLTTIAALMIAGPMALPASAQQGNSHQDDHGRGNDHRDNDRRDNDRNWDQSQHNGYYVGKAWHAGPPPVEIQHRNDYRPAYKAWARGDHLGYYNTRYVVVDYRERHLKRPPHGYHWVQDDRGDLILAAVAGGLIASVILGNH